jgi:S-adenosylmethionine synthetase
MVAAGLADEVLVQVAYAIGVAKPTNIYVNTYGTAKVAMSDGQIAQIIQNVFDMRPKAIEERLKLRQPMYQETASYGHVGRTPQTVTKQFKNADGSLITKEVELFTWEKTDYVDAIKQAFSL